MNNDLSFEQIKGILKDAFDREPNVSKINGKLIACLANLEINGAYKHSGVEGLKDSHAEILGFGNTAEGAIRHFFDILCGNAKHYGENYVQVKARGGSQWKKWDSNQRAFVPA